MNDTKTKQVGKRVSGDLYVHRSSISNLADDDQKTIKHAISLIGKKPKDWNVVRIANDNVAFLTYGNFDEDPFPALKKSVRVDLFDGRIGERGFEKYSNPPILHRKELLVDESYSGRAKFSALTIRLEELGVFYDVHRIGFRHQWEARLKSHEIEIADHKVVAYATVDPDRVLRHKTALIRYQLSQPTQLLMRYGLIGDKTKFFDYGCGRGDDVDTLKSGGIDASGWDPYYAKTNKKKKADVVNIGFVLNVIEDKLERDEAITGAWVLTKKILAVSVITQSSAAIENAKPFKDGFMTSIGTFQRYFSQTQLREYITSVLSEEPIAVGPGIYFVFRDKIAEQEFLLRRQQRENRRAIHLRSQRERPTKSVKPIKSEVLKPQLEQLWEEMIVRGRSVHQSELPPELRDALKIERVSLKRAEDFCRDELYESSDLDNAASERQDDLRVYLALEMFSDRKPYRELPKSLQYDLRAFWGSHANAQIDARNLLFSVGDTSLVRAACDEMADEGFGYWVNEGQLQFHSSVLKQFPAILRCYIGCAGILYGEMESPDLIKIHVDTGKLTLQYYENFQDPLPELRMRVKIDMKSQRVRVFDYHGSDRQYLFMKSLYIPDDFEDFDGQSKFDAAIMKFDEFDFSNYGPSAEYFDEILVDYGMKIDGFDLVT